MKILRFGDIENLEYRKGSLKYGNLLLRLMEFLRLYKDDRKIMKFYIDEFEKASNIRITDLQEMMNDKDGKNLYKFDITIDNEFITFTNLTSNKSRFFEKNDIE